MAEAYGNPQVVPAVFVSRGPDRRTPPSAFIPPCRIDADGRLRRPCEFKVDGPRSFQEINQHAFFGEVAKAVLSPENTDDIPALLQGRSPLYGWTAGSGRGANSEMSHRWIRTPRFQPEPARRTRTRCRYDRKSRDHDRRCKAPLVIAGEIISNQNASTELTVFVAAGGLPVMSAYRRLDVMANSHACYAGHLEINRFESQLAAIEACDLVIAVGSRLDGITSADETMLCIGKQLIHIYPDPEILDRFESDVAIDSDMKPALDALRRHLTPPDAQRAARTEILHNDFLAFSQPGNFTAYGDVDLARVIDTMDRLVDQETTIVTDAGSFSRWIHRYRRFERPHTKAGPMSGAMGYSRHSAWRPWRRAL